MFGSFGSFMPRPQGQSGLASQMGGSLGGFGSQPMNAPQQQAAAPQPSTGGRIPVSGGTTPDLSKLFAEADKMAAQSGGGGEMVNGRFQPDEATLNAYRDYQLYNKLYQNGPYSPHSIVAPVQRLKATRDQQRQMDMMSLSGMPQSEILTNMGQTALGEGGNSAASTAAQKDAEQFLASLGLGGGTSSGGSSGGSSSRSSGGSSSDLASRITSARSSTQQSGGSSANFVDPTAPGRIPVSTGTAATPGSITTKPAGVSNSDWQKYKSLSDKIENRDRPISSKNQKWYDNFVAKYGTSTPAPGGGGGGGGGGSTPLPGGSTGGPQDYAAGLGLLTRPYDNPFERRNLWNQFPGGP